MTIHRFFIEPEYIKNNFVEFPTDTAHQIANVLRLRKGDKVIVLDNENNEYEVILEESHKREVKGNIINKRANNNDLKVKIILYQALIPKDKFEMLLQKVTEIGVSEIVPLETERSVINANMISDDRLIRWQRIVKEAAEQSERSHLPEIKQPQKFKNALEDSLKEGKVLIALEREEKKAFDLTKLSSGKRISIFIGPEGGFTDAEITLAKSMGVEILSLGSRILRSETAAITSASILAYQLEDWK